MSKNQLKKIHGIFKAEKMKIRPSEIKLPEHFKLTWETVGGADRSLLYSPNADFMDNIEKYQENRFLNIGKENVRENTSTNFFSVQVDSRSSSGSSRTSWRR